MWSRATALDEGLLNYFNGFYVTTGVFLLIACSVLASQGGLFERVVPRATGRNGYEEYVRAAERIDTAEYREWRAGASRRSALENKRWILEKYRPVLELVRQGNAKPVSEPRTEYDIDTRFPEFAGFRQVTTAMVDAAYAEFAAGRSAQGTERLLQALIMSRNLGDVGHALAYLMGIVQEGWVFDEFAARLEQLSKADCGRIEAVVADLLRRPTTAHRIFEHSILMTRRAVDRVLEDPKSALGDDEAALRRAIEGLSAEERREFRRAMDGLCRETYDPIIRAFQASESQWPIGQGTPELPEARLDTVDGIAQALFRMITPSYRNIGVSAARSRTQLRLLRLYARVLAYRWEHGQLPARLEDASAEVIDPFSGRPFVYRVTEGWFEILGEGRSPLGEITLKTQHTAGVVDPGKPPSSLIAPQVQTTLPFLPRVWEGDAF